jgi:Ankyrin repeat
MPARTLPIRPDLQQLRHLAKDLLREYRAGQAETAADFRNWHPRSVPPADAKLTDAQLVLARSHGFGSWRRLRAAVELLWAIHDEDVDRIRSIVAKHPDALHQSARGTNANWGPPLSFAANLGKLRAIETLAALGAKDLGLALSRAALRGQERTAEWLLSHGAVFQPGVVMFPCESLNDRGLAFALSHGAPLADDQGSPLAPVALILQTYGRNPEGKHRCLELCEQHGVGLPDTPAMAFHRGRLDLLDAHLQRDPNLVHRRFTYAEIYLSGLGCDPESTELGLHGTPIVGGTLLHLCMDFDEPEIAAWLLDCGADVDACSSVDAEGFGGHTPLFNAVVSQATCCGRQEDGALACLLLGAGANPSARASLRKRILFNDDDTRYEYPGVTPLSYGRRFRQRQWVNDAALRAVEQAGGKE